MKINKFYIISKKQEKLKQQKKNKQKKLHPSVRIKGNSKVNYKIKKKKNS